jgi:hypothetical protein
LNWKEKNVFFEGSTSYWTKRDPVMYQPAAPAHCMWDKPTSALNWRKLISSVFSLFYNDYDITLYVRPNNFEPIYSFS